MTAVLPIDALAQVSASTTACAPQGCADPFRHDQGDLQRLTARFEDMMARTSGAPAMDHGAAAHAAHAAPMATHDVNKSGMAEILQKQQDLMSDSDAKLDELADRLPSMSLSELQSATVQVSRELAMQNFRLQCATSLSSASNKSLQSLLKNS